MALKIDHKYTMKSSFSNIFSVIERSRIVSPITDLFDTKPKSNQPSVSARSLISDVLKNSLTAYRPPRTIPAWSSIIPRIDASLPKKSISLTNLNLSRLSIHESLSNIDIGDLMGVFYRIVNERHSFFGMEFRVTKSVKSRLVDLSHSLGLLSTSSKFAFTTSSMLYTDIGNGLRSIATPNWAPKKYLLEFVTYFKGEYGRLLILVSTGVGCTVWYTFMPGVPEAAPPEMLQLGREISYPEFFNISYELQSLQKIFFIESRNVAASVLSAFEEVYPFSEMPINIPVDAENAIPNPEKRVAVCLGIMVVVFLTLGIVPNMSTSSLTVQA